MNLTIDVKISLEKDGGINQCYHTATMVKKSNIMETSSGEIVHLSRCFPAPPSPACLGNGQAVSPMRLMAHRPHLDPFISCFQNDISLATEEQQARQEQRSSVWRSQTNTGQENMPRSQQAETDRPTMDPPLTSL